MKRALLFVVLPLVLIGNGKAAVINVPGDMDLPTALNTAASNGEADTINIAADTYYTSGSTFSYNAAATENYSLTIVGAGVGNSILDGGKTEQVMNIVTTGVTNDDTAHITIRGITFQNGTEVPAPGDGYGGGLYVATISANATVEDSEFISNTAGDDGGGIELSSVNGNLELRNNSFIGNSSQDDSAGAWAWSSSGTVTYTGNVFSNNSANSIGGALAGSNTGTVVLTNNIFGGNSATSDYGGGAAIFSDSGTVTITNNTFYGNDTSTDGGGLYVWLQFSTATANIYNNIIWGNTKGGGVSRSDLYVIDEARFPPTGTGATVNLYNNDYTDFYIADGDHLSTGLNIDVDPEFVDVSDPDPSNWDLHITTSSPCKDAGTAAAPELPTTDIDGQLRTVGSAPDIGADEFSPASLLTGDGGGGFCFIATAAYGSHMSKEVKVLQRVRDEYLLPNELGRSFVSGYYKYSPTLARWIAKHPMMRKMVRIGLYPIMEVSKWFVGEKPPE